MIDLVRILGAETSLGREREFRDTVVKFLLSVGSCRLCNRLRCGHLPCNTRSNRLALATFSPFLFVCTITMWVLSLLCLRRLLFGAVP